MAWRAGCVPSKDGCGMWDEREIGENLVAAGFRKTRPRNWVRRTDDVVQLVNLQRSQWSKEDNYLNFALWPLVMGEPPSLSESRFPFRLRVEGNLAALLPRLERDFGSLQRLRQSIEAYRTAWVTLELRAILDGNG
ncbi:DUF4304 domain-containing protein [Mesorhizobium sp. NPDC059025]|uniref:DUF4304 domain-containing protein n=1 Tax=unclassified Mesorhizobium TaxID=325217 RepID=UPI0036B59FF4